MSRYNVAELAQTLFEEAGDALFLFDPQTEQILDVNPVAQRLTGSSRRDLLRLPITAVFHSEAPGQMRRLRKAFEITGLFHSQEGFLLRQQPAGKWIPVNLTITRLHTEPTTVGLITARDVREQREAYERLKATEAELQRVLASVSDYLWSAERDEQGAWVRLYYSPAVERITGRPPSFYLPGPERWLSTIHAEDRERVKHAFASVKAGAVDQAVEEYRIILPDGAVRWVRDSVMLRSKGNGKALTIDGVVSDVTESRNAQESLRTSEERFRALVENSSDAVMILNSEGTILYSTPDRNDDHWHGEYRKAGASAFDCVHADDVARVRAQFAAVLTHPDRSVTVEFRGRHPDGSWRFVEAVGKNRLHDPNVQGIVVNHRDVSERKLAEEKLRLSEQRHRFLVEHMTDIIWTMDLHLQTTFVSPSVFRLTGYTVEERMQLTLAESLTPASAAAARELLTHYLTNHSRPDDPVQIATLEHESVCKDGSTVWAESRITFLRDPSGQPTGLMGVTRDIRERKQGEKALRAAEEKYRSLFEHAAEGIYQTRTEGTFVTANPMLARLFGYESAAEFVTCVDLAREGYVDPSRRTAFLAKMHEQGFVAGFESQIRRHDGAIRWVSENARSIRDAQGTITEFEGTVVDITERKRAEQEILQQNRQLAALSETGQALNRLIAPEAILELMSSTIGRVLDSRNFSIAFCDEDARRIDFPLYTVEGQEAHRASRPFADGLTEHVIRTRAPILIQHDMAATLQALGIGQHGRPTRCFMAVPMLLGDRVLGVMALQDYQQEGAFGPADLTLLATFAAQAAIALENARLYAAMHDELAERRRAEEALRASEARYRALVDNLEQCIFLKDHDLRFVAVNGRLCAVLQRSEAEVLGKTDVDLYPIELAEKYRLDDLRVLQQAVRIEHEEETLFHGQLRVVRVIKTPVRDGSGAVTGVLGIFWDVTEQRALEAQLRQVQKMDAIGHLAGGIAHDFNNLLTGILGNVSLTLAAMSPHDLHRDAIVAAEKATLRAAELVRKLLGFSRRTMLHLQPTNLNHCLGETLDIIRPGLPPGIMVERQLSPELWPVQADPGQMSQVFLNLCLNARDAMTEQGKLTLETANIVIGPDHLRNHVQARAGSFVRLRVADTGHGIPADVLPRIFEPFFTTKDPGKGTGLGLAMVFGILEQHRGWIECHGGTGQGTRFDLYLPRSVTECQRPSLTEPPRSSVSGHETVLIVEDEPLIRTLGKTILERHGYKVLLAEDGLRGLEVYESAPERPDLVLLDLTMPRLSGIDTLDRLVEMDPQVRVLFSSGYSSDLPSVRHDSQVFGFIGKPYRPEELARAVRNALDLPHPARARSVNGHPQLALR